MMATKLAEIAADLPDLLDDTEAACAAADLFLAAAKEQVLLKVSRGGKVDAALFETEQLAAHGFAWLKVYVEALRAMDGWGRRLHEAGRFGEREELILRLAFAEYLARIAGGIPMNQVEIVRAYDFGLHPAAVDEFLTEPVVRLIEGATPTTVWT
jgi:(2S)-methylsuccinyl-CoA dehydrogenase